MMTLFNFSTFALCYWRVKKELQFEQNKFKQTMGQAELRRKMIVCSRLLE